MKHVGTPILLSVIALLFFGCDSNDSDSETGASDFSIDDIEVTVQQQQDSLSGTPEFDVTFENNSGRDIQTLSATFRLLNGDEIVDTGDAIFTSNLRAGQSGTATATFFEIDSHDDYACYEYDLEVISRDLDIGVQQATYSGTC